MSRFLLAGILALGCANTKGLPGGADDDGGTDADTDADVDGDTDGDGDCSGDETDCGGTCVDLSSDEAHCGKCDYACGVDVACEDGACICGGEECRPGEDCIDGECHCARGTVDCGDECANVSNDVENCGACDSPCPTGGICEAGQCECPEALVVCDDACVDLSTNRAHCGGCGDECWGSCESGVCDCGDLLECTDWVEGGTYCTDSSVDSDNCRYCGYGCWGDEICEDSNCVCAPGTTLCETDYSEDCVDTRNHPRHCGGCNSPCEDGTVCSDGDCVEECPDGTEGCSTDYDVAAEYCADLDTDRFNCGDCGLTSWWLWCDATEICLAGTCTPYKPAFGCSECPCDVCIEGTVCCSMPDEPTMAICVYGDSCP